MTIRVVVAPLSSPSSLAALDLAYRHAADHLSYEDLLAIDFPSFSSLSSYDGDGNDIALDTGLSNRNSSHCTGHRHRGSEDTVRHRETGTEDALVGVSSQLITSTSD